MIYASCCWVPAVGLGSLKMHMFATELYADVAVRLLTFTWLCCTFMCALLHHACLSHINGTRGASDCMRAENAHIPIRMLHVCVIVAHHYVCVVMPGISGVLDVA
jgi:hypothetical protein